MESYGYSHFLLRLSSFYHNRLVTKSKKYLNIYIGNKGQKNHGGTSTAYDTSVLMDSMYK
jgi:hypothetical protein